MGQNLIYAFALPDRSDVTKVGKTEQGLTRRLQDAHSFHPFGVRFLGAWSFSDSVTLRVAEREILKRLPPFRSEWFGIKPEAALDAVARILGRPADYQSSDLSLLAGVLKAYDNFSGKSVTYKTIPLKLRLWVHQRKQLGLGRELKLSRNPWRRPPNTNVSGTKYLNLGDRTYAPEPFAPLSVFELADDKHDVMYAANNARIMSYYDEFREVHRFDVLPHLRTGWTPLRFDELTALLRAAGFIQLSAFGPPLVGEHPKQ